MWDSLQDLFLTLMDEQLVRGYEVEQCYIGALGSVTDEVRCLQERCYSKRFSLLFVCLFVCLFVKSTVCSLATRYWSSSR